jgi:hypothetical protein
MNTELETSVPTSGRSECLSRDDSQNKVVHKPMPPLERTRVKRLETSEEIGRALCLTPAPTKRTLPSMVVALGALVIVCIALAAVVWWRLLT